ncbi:hypothetical protein K501DRAFT_285521 [Backusella circina FSU 941]|nr:hypothetical protein K501DRAFT_285521 [Backusella circina FSU 941]
MSVQNALDFSLFLFTKSLKYISVAMVTPVVSLILFDIAVYGYRNLRLYASHEKSA